MPSTAAISWLPQQLLPPNRPIGAAVALFPRRRSGKFPQQRGAKPKWLQSQKDMS
jgi:hypothetical protein